MMNLRSTQAFLEQKVLLIVDDDLSNRTLIVDLVLEYLPEMTVLTAIHGEQALYILAQKKVDVMLLDWEMPIMNGIETLKALRKNEDWSEIPVIMYTGAMTATHNLQEAFEFGAVDFLRKPADSAELISRIRSVVYQRTLEQNRRTVEQALLQAKKEHLEQEMTLLRKELNAHLLLLAHKNKVLVGIKQQCLEKDVDTKARLQKIARHVGQLISEDDYWGEFMEKFNQTDPQFVKSLLAKYSNLSKGEVRMCALIRFGMESKDIMNLLNISAEGVKKSRYRIRKKMELQKEDSLDKQLLEL
jgi:DNA-binding response OmpR family regulator/DNA-binding CsgD family transcriptional regulator